MSDDIANRLRNKHADDLLAWEAADEIKRLRKERDEARREVCELSARCVRADYFLRIKNPTHTLPQDVAESRGWGCYEKVKP